MHDCTCTTLHSCPPLAPSDARSLVPPPSSLCPRLEVLQAADLAQLQVKVVLVQVGGCVGL